jgi:hypothetical protein
VKLSRPVSLLAALVATATLSACGGTSNPTGASPLESVGPSPAASSGTVKAQVSPNQLFKTTPKADTLDQINGKAPLSVMFNMCAITDADRGDALGYTFEFGDGATAGHHCRAEHIYEKQGTFEATICVHDKRLADRSEVCATYKVKVRGEAEAGTPVVQSGSVTLCDEYFYSNNLGRARNGDMCGIPSDPNTRYAFDFDSLQKVPVLDGRADFAKGQGFYSDPTTGGRPGAPWSVLNGAVQADTGVGSGQLGTVTCSASDGRKYSGAGIVEYQPSESVICLRTAAGRYVQYTARFKFGSDNVIDYVVN